MADNTGIEWTDATWQVTHGCRVVSPGCTNCYAMKMAHRLQAMGQSAYAGLTQRTNGGAVWNGVVRPASDAALLQPLRWKRPRRIFVDSMADLFAEDVEDAWIDRAFAVMALCPQHTFQVLTKRAERMRSYFTRANAQAAIEYYCGNLAANNHVSWSVAEKAAVALLDNWPLRNIMLGVSVEDQQRADERIPHLLATPAAVRFLSCEPLLGPVDLTAIRGFYRAPEIHRHDRASTRERMNVLAGRDRREHLRIDGTWNHRRADDPDSDPCFTGNRNPRIDWVIAGNESGPHRRPGDLAWMRSLRDQCSTAGVAFFAKQDDKVKPLPDDLVGWKRFPHLAGVMHRAMPEGR